MEWLNIHSSTLGSDEVLDSAPEDQATWLFLLSYCAGQENGGRLTGAKHWTNDRCLRALKVPRERLKEKAELWRWDGDDLLVALYPLEKELEVRKKRQGAAIGGQIRGEQLRAQAKTMAQREGKPMAKAQAKRKGREGNGRKRKGTRREAASLSGVSSIPSESDVRAWATTAEVDPDFAAQKWSELCERHGWHQNGTLLDWRARFSRIWKSDGPQWEASQKKRGAAAGGLTLPANALPTDPTWWWTDPIESLGAVQAGAALAGDQKNAARLGEVIAARRKGA